MRTIYQYWLYRCVIIFPAPRRPPVQSPHIPDYIKSAPNTNHTNQYQLFVSNSQFSVDRVSGYAILSTVEGYSS